MKKSWKFILSLIGTTVISGGVISTCIASCGSKKIDDHSPKSINLDDTTDTLFKATAYWTNKPQTQNFTPTYKINVSPEDASKEVIYHLEDTGSSQPHNAKIDEETGKITFDTFDVDSYEHDLNHSFTLKVYVQSKINKKIKSEPIDVTVTATYGQPDTLELIVNGNTTKEIKANENDQMFWTDDKKLISKLSCSRFTDLEPNIKDFETDYEFPNLPDEWKGKVVAADNGNIQIKKMNSRNQLHPEGKEFTVIASVKGASYIQSDSKSLKLIVNYADPTNITATYNGSKDFTGFLGSKGSVTTGLNVNVLPETASQEVKYEIINDSSGNKIHISEDGSKITWDSVNSTEPKSYTFGIKVSTKANPNKSTTVSDFSLTLNKTDPTSIHISGDGSLLNSAFYKQAKSLNKDPLQVSSDSPYDDLSVTWSLIGKNGETTQAIDNEQLLISQQGVISYTNSLQTGNYSYQVKAVAIHGDVSDTTATHTLSITRQPSNDFTLTFDSKTGDTFPVNTDASASPTFSKDLGAIKAKPNDPDDKYSYDLEYKLINPNNLPITITPDSNKMSAEVSVGMIDRIISSPEQFRIEVSNTSIPGDTPKTLTFNLTTNKINPTSIIVDTAGTTTKQLTLETDNQTLDATFTATPNDPEITYSDVTWSAVMTNASGEPTGANKPDWLNVDGQTGEVSFNSTIDETLLNGSTYFKVKATSTKDSNVSGLSSTCEITFKRPLPERAVINVPDALLNGYDVIQLTSGKLNSSEYLFNGSIEGKQTSDKTANFSIIPSQGTDQDLVKLISIESNEDGSRYLKWGQTKKTGTAKFHIRITSNADSTIFADSSEITFTFKPKYSISYIAADNEENRLYQVGCLDETIYLTSAVSMGTIKVVDNSNGSSVSPNLFNWIFKNADDGSIDTHSEASAMIDGAWHIKFHNFSECGVYNLSIIGEYKSATGVSYDSSNTVKVKVWGNNWVPLDQLSINSDKMLTGMVGGNESYNRNKYEDTQIDTFTVPNNVLKTGNTCLIAGNNFLFPYLTNFRCEDESVLTTIGNNMCSSTLENPNGQGFESVSFPDSLKYIGQWAFARQSIKHIEDFKNVRHIDQYAFAYNSSKDGTYGTWKFHSNYTSSIIMGSYMGLRSGTYDTAVITHNWGGISLDMLCGYQYSKLTTFVLDGFTSYTDLRNTWLDGFGTPNTRSLSGAHIGKLIFRNSNNLSQEQQQLILRELIYMFGEYDGTRPFTTSTTIIVES